MQPAFKMKIDKDIFDNGVELEAKVKYEFLRWIQKIYMKDFKKKLKNVIS